MPDGEILNIPVSTGGVQPVEPPAAKPPEKIMPNEVDATISKVLDQSFAKSSQVGLQAADRASASNDAVAELARNIFLGEVSKVGTREAAAMQRMDTDKLSEKILDARAASGQPQFSPAGGSAAGTGAAGR